MTLALALVALFQDEIEYAPGVKLDLYKPRDLTGKAPAIVFIHGGGWEGGDKRPMPLAQEAARRGYVAISINYRLSGQAPFPAAVEDCRAAVRWLRKQPYVGRIGAWGHSAGGHLALMLGCTDEEKVHAVVAWSAPTDLSKKFAEREIRKFLNGADPARASPITFVTKDDAPALLVHGDRDPIVPVEQARLMFDRLKQAGCEVELLIQKNGGHAFEGAGVEPAFPRIVEASFEFLNRHLAK